MLKHVLREANTIEDVFKGQEVLLVESYSCELEVSTYFAVRHSTVL